MRKNQRTRVSRRCVIIPAHCDTLLTDTNSRHLKNNNNAGIRKSVTDEQRLQNDRTGVDQAGSEGSKDECRESVRDDRGGDVSYRLPRCRLVKEVLILYVLTTSPFFSSTILAENEWKHNLKTWTKRWKRRRWR